MALDAARRAIVALSERAQALELGRDVRTLLARTAKSLRAGNFERDSSGIAATEARHLAETSTWASAAALGEGRGGPFDVLDLRCWLALAGRAGVPCVPARTILELDDEEMSAAGGSVQPAPTPLTRGVARMASRLLETPSPTDIPRVDAGHLAERLMAAMDDVPEGWMVRYARCGGSNLKALAGSGVAGPSPPEARFRPDLEVGPGWVRRGNRRAVDAANLRTVQAAASGPGAPHAFLARPWISAARWALGEDPQRHGTQFAGRGMWPAEWRAFVVDGKVEGVASYYGWCGAATPRNARVALAVRDLAQRIADEAVRQGAVPRFADIELVRSSGHPDVVGDPRVASELERLGRDKVAMGLDFLEAHRGPGEHGLVFLEGGPTMSTFGGGHPCAFAGCGGPPRDGNRTAVEGVAFRLMDGVLLADPATWYDGDRTGRVLAWREVEDLAKGEPGDEVPAHLRAGAEPVDYRAPD